MLIAARTLDSLADELRRLTRMDVERLFMRMTDAEAIALFEDVFYEEMRELVSLRDELQTIEGKHEAEVNRLQDKIDDLSEELSEAKADLRSIECDRDFLQGRIHCLTGETFDDKR